MAHFGFQIGVAIICAILSLVVLVVREGEDSAESCALICKNKYISAMGVAA